MKETIMPREVPITPDDLRARSGETLKDLSSADQELFLDLSAYFINNYRNVDMLDLSKEVKDEDRKAYETLIGLFEKRRFFDPNAEGEEAIPKITKAEWDEFCNLSISDPQLLVWMKEKGIRFDMGNIKIEVDGVKEKMATDKENFGNFLEREK